MRTINEVEEFLAASHQLRGYVRLELVPVDTTVQREHHAVADELVKGLGFTPIGRLAWSVLSPGQAIELLKNMLHRAMAYHQELLPLKTAEHVARVLVGSLSPYESTFLANGSITPGKGAGWIPIGTATFEMAVVAFDRTHAFLLYAEDED